MFRKVDGYLMFKDSAYKFFKKSVQVYIPAASSLYFGLGNIWGFPAIEQVVGSCAVVATTLGIALGLSSKQYDASDAGYDGKLNVETSEKGRKIFSLDIKGDPEKLEQKSAITFRVSPK